MHDTSSFYLTQENWSLADLICLSSHSFHPWKEKREMLSVWVSYVSPLKTSSNRNFGRHHLPFLLVFLIFVLPKYITLLTIPHKTTSEGPPLWYSLLIWRKLLLLYTCFILKAIALEYSKKVLSKCMNHGHSCPCSLFYLEELTICQK